MLSLNRKQRLYPETRWGRIIQQSQQREQPVRTNAVVSPLKTLTPSWRQQTPISCVRLALQLTFPSYLPCRPFLKNCSDHPVHRSGMQASWPGPPAGQNREADLAVWVQEGWWTDHLSSVPEPGLWEGLPQHPHSTKAAGSSWHRATTGESQWEPNADGAAEARRLTASKTVWAKR